jgi:hypothetical protein
METLQIEKKNAVVAYMQGGTTEKTLLENLFGKQHFLIDVCDRVLTVQDACVELGKDYATRYGSITDPYKQAETDIELFAEALREGKAAGDCYYYPYFLRSSGGGFSFGGCDCGDDYSRVGARLRVDTSKKATHLGKCMIAEYKVMDKG